MCESMCYTTQGVCSKSIVVTLFGSLTSYACSSLHKKSTICHTGVLNVCFKCWLFLCFINQNRISKNNEGNQNKYFCISSEWSLCFRVTSDSGAAMDAPQPWAGVALGLGHGHALPTAPPSQTSSCDTVSSSGSPAAALVGCAGKVTVESQRFS